MDNKTLASYFLMGVNHAEAKGLHDLVVEYKNRLFNDGEDSLRYILLGQFSRSKEKPKSFLDIGSSVIRRELVRAHLCYLHYMVGVVTTPQVVLASGDSPELIVFKEGEILMPQDRLISTNGLDPAAIEHFQREYWENLDVVSDIREYRMALERAFDPYNLQFVLNQFGRIRAGATFDLEGGEVEIADSINSIFDTRNYSVLEDVYYNEGNRHLYSLGNYWAKLDGHPYGKNFRLTEEEAQQFLGAIIRRGIGMI